MLDRTKRQVRLKTSFAASLALIAVVGASLAACGGGDGGRPAASGTIGPSSHAEQLKSSPTMTKDEYIRRGDAVCSDLVSSVRELRRAKSATGRAATVRVLRVLDAKAAASRAKFAQIPPPRGDEKTILRILELQQRATDLSIQETAAIARGDKASASRVQAVLQRTNHQERRLFHQYGFRRCGAAS